MTSAQRAVVASQADQHGWLPSDCRSCNGQCHVKDWRPHRIASPFGEVMVRLPRFLCAACNRTETGVNWPLHCRSTPELDQLQARLSALMTYRVAAGVPVASPNFHYGRRIFWSSEVWRVPIPRRLRTYLPGAFVLGDWALFDLKTPNVSSRLHDRTML
jgi:hypothetical protein